eukprot:scpid76352/ scgid19097/ 
MIATYAFTMMVSDDWLLHYMICWLMYTSLSQDLHLHSLTNTSCIRKEIERHICDLHPTNATMLTSALNMELKRSNVMVKLELQNIAILELYAMESSLHCTAKHCTTMDKAAAVVRVIIIGIVKMAVSNVGAYTKSQTALVYF